MYVCVCVCVLYNLYGTWPSPFCSKGHYLIVLTWLLMYMYVYVDHMTFSSCFTGRPTVEELTDPNGRYVKRSIDVSYKLS